MTLGIIADDFTGATDVAGFLVNNGLRTLQLNGVPEAPVDIEADAVVISLKSRSCSAQRAIEQSLAALKWLQTHGCQRFFFKYCSTFDSTAEGNIGPVTDALLEALGESFTVICPALPVNGRTTYQGYLFVNGVPLNESGMRHHPVTPMTDANLMRVMEGQAGGQAGNVTVDQVEKGVEAVRAQLSTLKQQGKRYAVLDALNDRHLQTIGEAVDGLTLVTGGSGLADGMTRHWEGRPNAEQAGAPNAGSTVILAGSCSEMTNRQVTAYRDSVASLAIAPDRAMAEDLTAYVNELVDWFARQPNTPHAPLIYATMPPAELKQVQERYGAHHASERIETLFGALAAALADTGVSRFIIAGGETSGAVTQALGINGFIIGPQIAPGVPWVKALDHSKSLALKSGNFGADIFFFDAQRIADQNTD
ncbi:3-oxo-tetronate kinase [Carnimonas nigrificans]|uniref:3-oxo-tetronate kinase n=1 Tax=Carnimonas nigrificans TaxID=64323 RepID=UPI00046E9BED|nr:3-oxo-tetronate kinase [Carnimonas nigrificans]